MAEFTYPEEHSDPADLLAALGWRTVVTDLHKLFSLTGLPGLRRQDLNAAPVAGRYVRAAWPVRAGMRPTARREKLR